MDNDELVKWLHEQQANLLQEIARLQIRYEVYGEMLVKLPTPTAAVTKQKVVTAGRKVVPKQKGASLSNKVLNETKSILEAAGTNGLTSKEYAEVASIPVGTASARLSTLKTRGLASHVQPKYFVLHSKQEDNNVE